MLDSIKDFFVSTGDVITGLVDFVIGFIEDLVYVVKICGKFLAKIPDFFSWLPVEIVALVVVLFSIVVIYKIMGREG